MKKKLLAIILCAVLLTGVCATSFAAKDIGSVKLQLMDYFLRYNVGCCETLINDIDVNTSKNKIAYSFAQGCKQKGELDRAFQELKRLLNLGDDDIEKRFWRIKADDVYAAILDYIIKIKDFVYPNKKIPHDFKMEYENFAADVIDRCDYLRDDLKRG